MRPLSQSCSSLLKTILLLIYTPVHSRNLLFTSKCNVITHRILCVHSRNPALHSKTQFCYSLIICVHSLNPALHSFNTNIPSSLLRTLSSLFFPFLLFTLLSMLYSLTQSCYSLSQSFFQLHKLVSHSFFLSSLSVFCYSFFLALSISVYLGLHSQLFIFINLFCKLLWDFLFSFEIFSCRWSKAWTVPALCGKFHSI